jgi:hypothetical protein
MALLFNIDKSKPIYRLTALGPPTRIRICFAFIRHGAITRQLYPVDGKSTIPFQAINSALHVSLR